MKFVCDKSENILRKRENAAYQQTCGQCYLEKMCILTPTYFIKVHVCNICDPRKEDTAISFSTNGEVLHKTVSIFIHKVS